MAFFLSHPVTLIQCSCISPTQCVCSLSSHQNPHGFLGSPGSSLLCCHFLNKHFSPNFLMQKVSTPALPTLTSAYASILGPHFPKTTPPGCPSITSNYPHLKLTSLPAKPAPVFNQTSGGTLSGLCNANPAASASSWAYFSFPFLISQQIPTFPPLKMPLNVVPNCPSFCHTRHPTLPTPLHPLVWITFASPWILSLFSTSSVILPSGETFQLSLSSGYALAQEPK